MNFLKKRTEPVNTDYDQLAGRIAGGVVRRQIALAARLNHGINRFDKSRQRRLLWLFCAIWVIVLAVNLLLAAKLPQSGKPNQDFQPTHIGQAFEMPKPVARPKRQSDSLILKK